MVGLQLTKLHHDPHACWLKVGFSLSNICGMNIYRNLIPLGLTACVMAVVAVPASAWFESSTSNPIGRSIGTGVIVTVEAGGAELECKNDTDTWTVQEGTKQEATKTGRNLLLKVRFEGKPKAGTTKGSCDGRADGATIDAELSTPAELKFQQPSKGVNTGLQASLENSLEQDFPAIACKIRYPSKSNQNLGKASVVKSGLKNIKLDPEFKQVITAETVGAGCALAGLKGGKGGSIELGVDGEILEEGVIPV
jgi:hypothetical protein